VSTWTAAFVYEQAIGAAHHQQGQFFAAETVHAIVEEFLKIADQAHLRRIVSVSR
jgi:hypothetical protein